MFHWVLNAALFKQTWKIRRKKDILRKARGNHGQQDKISELSSCSAKFCIFQTKLRNFLTLSAPCISESCIKIKTDLNCYFRTSLWCLKRFYERLKGHQKTFWGTTNKCENKNLSYFFSPSKIGTVRVKFPDFLESRISILIH